MNIIKNNSPYRKLLLKRITTPLRISKRITDMKYKFNKIYRNFYLSSTDMKKQKEIEEYQKYQNILKLKRENFIKLTKIEFQQKINLKEIYPNKSAKFKENNKIYFNIIINYDKRLIYQPYLFPIKKREIMKYKCLTEINAVGVVKKIKSNNKKYAMGIFGNKKSNRSSNLIKQKLKSKSSLNIKHKNETNNIKNLLSKNYETLRLENKDKNKIIKIRKTLNLVNAKKTIDKNIFKSPNNFLRKKLILAENNDNPINIENIENIENVISPIKKVNEENNSNNNNIELNIGKDNNDKNIININNNDDKNRLNVNDNKDNKDNKDNISSIDNINNNILEVRNISLNKSINSKSISKDNKDNKEELSPINSLKYNDESSRNKMIENNIILNYNKKSTIENEKIEKNITLNLINGKATTIYDQCKNAFKLLPILNRNFNSTINKSNRLNRNIKTFKKEAKIRTKHSKRKTNFITKKYFQSIEVPNIKNSIKMAKKRNWSKEVNQYIYEDKKGHINFKFSYEKKKKSPLTFVEEYNRMRNRRRKNNKKITSNIGFKMFSKQDIKENKLKAYIGLSFNNNKYY